MKQFLVLFRGGDDRMTAWTQEQTREHFDRWGQFIGMLVQKNLFVDAKPIESGGRILSNEGVLPDAFGEGDARVSGYLMLKAEDYEQAIELCKTCPIFELNGKAEIREVNENVNP